MSGSVEAGKIIQKAISSDVRELDEIINESVTNWSYNSTTEFKIFSIFARIESKLKEILSRLVFENYDDQRITEYRKVRQTPRPIDMKAVEILIKDSIGDYTRMIKNAREFIGAFFKVARADIINEYDITQNVLNDMLDGGTLRTSIDSLEKEYKLRGDTIRTKILPYSKDDVAKKLNAFEKQIKRGMDPNGKSRPIVKALRQKMENSYKEKKIIQIINKNGKIMHFDLKYYSRLVARTRTARARIEGTISFGEQFGKYVLYRVSDHNTSTAKCEQFEGKYLSKDSELIGKTFKGIPILKMNLESTPIYHPNCKHGLTTVAITRNEYLSISGKSNK